jgi:DNA polymerase III delta prime subunit
MNIPWVEKYRPTEFDNIILDNFNKKILENILKKKYFPNMIFHGPPGTGKTTTIINLINRFNNICNEKTNNIIHLNASDDRGIDTIRSLIYNFINCKNMFSENNMKFVILDEVDCITKIAQQALKYIIQSNNKNIRFVLICNYITKIDYSLNNEFIKIRFNKLPCDKIYNFLNNINEKEKLTYTNNELIEVQKYFDSDIRSMINFLQNNSNEYFKLNLMNNEKLNELFNLNIKKFNQKNKDKFINFFYYLSYILNKDLFDILEVYIKYIIINKNNIDTEFLKSCEKILNSNNKDFNIIINLFYFIVNKYYL